mmetsp:Transcript_47713/g.88517  ORF Transcript_47713/g.88517 Transcript_47713/m.88517 type:complete len:158 (-) Transcript_47713:514-987(-)
MSTSHSASHEETPSNMPRRRTPQPNCRWSMPITDGVTGGIPPWLLSPSLSEFSENGSGLTSPPPYNTSPEDALMWQPAWNAEGRSRRDPCSPVPITYNSIVIAPTEPLRTPLCGREGVMKFHVLEEFQNNFNPRKGSFCLGCTLLRLFGAGIRSESE